MNTRCDNCGEEDLEYCARCHKGTRKKSGYREYNEGEVEDYDSVQY